MTEDTKSILDMGRKLKKQIDAGEFDFDAAEFAMQILFTQVAMGLGGNSAQVELVSARVQSLIDSLRQINTGNSSK